MKLSQVFTLARTALTTKNEYICLAIKYDLMNEVPEKDRKRALDLIRGRMMKDMPKAWSREPHYCCALETWLQHVHGIYTINDQKMADYRLRWLDALIDEFEAQDD